VGCEMRSLRLVTIALFLLAPVVYRGGCVSAADSSVVTIIRTSKPFPKVGEYDVLIGDFHCHTVKSDGKVTPRERIVEAYRFGLDVIAITDHRNFLAYNQVSRFANCLGILLIRGFETGISKKEHFVCLGVPPDYVPRDSHEWSETKEGKTAFCDEELSRIKDSGGLVIYAHPHMGMREPVLRGIERGEIVGIEVKNGVVGSGWNSVLSHGTYCYPDAFDWALRHNLAVMSSSDLHVPRISGDEPCTLVLVRERTPDGVLDAIRSRRTIAWFCGMLWGREELLRDLMSSMVSVSRSIDTIGTNFMRVTNRGPVELRLSIEGAGAGVTLYNVSPYGETLISWKGGPGEIKLKWENIWVTPRDNLIMPGPAAQPVVE